MVYTALRRFAMCRSKTVPGLVFFAFICIILTGCSKEITVNHYPGFYDPNIKTIAILPFENYSSHKGLGNAVANRLASGLMLNRTYKVIGPDQLNIMLNNLNLPAVPRGNDKAAAEELGKVGKIRAFVKGQVLGSTIISAAALQDNIRQQEFYAAAFGNPATGVCKADNELSGGLNDAVLYSFDYLANIRRVDEDDEGDEGEEGEGFGGDQGEGFGEGFGNGEGEGFGENEGEGFGGNEGFGEGFGNNEGFGDDEGYGDDEGFGDDEGYGEGFGDDEGYGEGDDDDDYGRDVAWYYPDYGDWYDSYFYEYVSHALIVVNASIISVPDGRILYSTHIQATGNVNGFRPETRKYVIQKTLHKLTRRLVRRFAVVPVEIKINPGKDFLLAERMGPGQWRYTNTFSRKDENVFVVVRLPRVAAHNRFEIVITPKNNPELIAAKRSIVWSRNRRHRAVKFLPGQIAEKHGPGSYSACFYSRGKLVMSRNFKIK